MRWCSCFRKTKVKPFDLDTNVENLVKDRNRRAYLIFQKKIDRIERERIERERKHKETERIY